IPNMPEEKMLGAVVTRLGRRHAAQAVIDEINPRGEKIFWMGAAGEAKDYERGTDFWAVSHGYVSMTPLQVDMTNYSQLEEFKNWWNN
ncbi:MAG: 5'/3'-nucleotidase SurE, partial [Burkholderiales bacterium]|nr:5'/3'-nucleotidase SurE [Burkholderiales bacterium]